MRPLVSYDDLATESPPQAPPSNITSGSPPKKKRKNNYRQGQRHGGNRPYQQDGGYNRDYKGPSKKFPHDYGLKSESRELTHDDVWDDSALIRAWDAAVEEYEVLNGPDKKWKSEPVTKSALWYNIPPEKQESSKSDLGPSFLMPAIPASYASQFENDEEQEEEEPEQEAGNETTNLDNSRPVNYHTFVPRHDPSLSNVRGSNDTVTEMVDGLRRAVPPIPRGVAQITKDEAFEHAMGAWYWAGYWTGVYHTKGASASNDQLTKEVDSEPQLMDKSVELEDDTEQIYDEIVGEDTQVGDEDLLPT